MVYRQTILGDARAARATLAALAAAIFVASVGACEDPTPCDQTPPLADGSWPRVARVAFPFAVDEAAATYLMTRGHIGYACDPETPEGERACPLDISALRWDERRAVFTRRRVDRALGDHPFAGDVMWEMPVLAPVRGRVIACWRGMPDDDDDHDDVNCPGGDRLCSAGGNFVTILADEGYLVTLCHLRAESVPLELCPIREAFLYADEPRACALGRPWEGQRERSSLARRGLPEPTVEVGDFVGRVGASGSGKGIHLHLHAKPHAHDGAGHCEGPSLPLAFEGTRYARACEGVDPALARWLPLAGDVPPIDGATLLLTPEESGVDGI